MNKTITVGYVEGYKDATVTVRRKMKEILERNGTNPLFALNEVIANMYKQDEEVKRLEEVLSNQMNEEAPSIDEDCVDVLIKQFADKFFNNIITQSKDDEEEEYIFDCDDEDYLCDGCCDNCRSSESEDDFKTEAIKHAISSIEEAVNILGAESYTLTINGTSKGEM